MTSPEDADWTAAQEVASEKTLEKNLALALQTSHGGDASTALGFRTSETRPLFSYSEGLIVRLIIGLGDFVSGLIGVAAVAQDPTKTIYDFASQVVIGLAIVSFVLGAIGHLRHKTRCCADRAALLAGFGAAMWVVGALLALTWLALSGCFVFSCTKLGKALAEVVQLVREFFQ